MIDLWSNTVTNVNPVKSSAISLSWNCKHLERLTVLWSMPDLPTMVVMTMVATDTDHGGHGIVLDQECEMRVRHPVSAPRFKEPQRKRLPPKGRQLCPGAAPQVHPGSTAGLQQPGSQY